MKDVPLIVRLSMVGLAVIIFMKLLPGEWKTIPDKGSVSVVDEEEIKKSMCRSYGGIPRPGMRFGCTLDYLYGGCDFPLSGK